MELDDFTPFLEGIKEEEKETLEEKYKRELMKLKAEFEREIERVKEEFYSLGFKKGYQKASKEYEEVLLEKERELSLNYSRKLDEMSLNIDSVINEIKRENEKRLKKFLSVLNASLVEILSALYISPSNLDFLKGEIYRLVEEFSQEELLAIEVGKGLKEVVKGEKVKLNEELDDYDFRLVFKDFKVESSFKEKLNLIREEIEREAKETA
ncbi:hypothetical protein [Thermovibrio sp.]